MKNSLIIAGCVALALAVTSCGDSRDPGRAYMPDMAYSRAYETYTDANKRLNESGIDSGATNPYFTGRPVEGTVARGEMAHYALHNDSLGYVNSASVKNPLEAATVNMKDAERLYLINCAICHGSKLDGMGPLFKGGDGPYSAAPKNFLADDMKKLPEGTMFHSVTYGKGMMGSYASQMTTRQRWMVIAYIKSKQGGGTTAAPDSLGAPAKVDSNATAMKK